MLVNLILETIFGAIAGYATNDVAIKTLFKPGGTIEKNREHFTRQISALLEDEILTSEDLAQILNKTEVESALSKVLKHLLTAEIPAQLQNVTINELDQGYLSEHLTHLLRKLQADDDFLCLFSDALRQSLPPKVIDEFHQALVSAADKSLNSAATFTALFASAAPLLTEEASKPLKHYLDHQAALLAQNIYADSAARENTRQFFSQSFPPSFIEQSIEQILSLSLADWLSAPEGTANEKILSYLRSADGQELLNYYGQKIHQSFQTDLTLGELLTLPPMRSLILPLIKEQGSLLCSLFLQWLSANKPFLTNLIDQAINEALTEQEGISALVSKILHDFLGDGERFSGEFLLKAQEFLLENLEAEQLLDLFLQADSKISQLSLAELSQNITPAQIKELLHALLPAFLASSAGQSLLLRPLKDLVNLPEIDYAKLSENLFSSLWQPHILHKGFKYLADLLLHSLSTQSLRELLLKLNLSADELNSILPSRLKQALPAVSLEPIIRTTLTILLSKSETFIDMLVHRPLADIYRLLFTSQAQEAALPALSGSLQNILIQHLPGHLSPLAYESLNTLSNEDMLLLVREFMGKELKPLNYLGAGMGGIVGLATGGVLAYLPPSALNGLYLAGKLAVFGAVGYTTNCAAIKGLFWPYKPLGGMKFAQGVIPKRQEAFARSLGQLFDSYVLNPQSLTDILERNKENIQAILQKQLLLSESQCSFALKNTSRYLLEHCPQKANFCLNDFYQSSSADFSPLLENIDLASALSPKLAQELKGYLTAEKLATLTSQSLPQLFSQGKEYFLSQKTQDLLPQTWQKQGLSALQKHTEQLITPILAAQTADMLNKALLTFTPADLLRKDKQTPLRLPEKLIISLLDFLCQYLKDNQDKLTIFVQNLIKARLNMLQTFGYLAMNGDYLLANILSRFIQIKFPLFCGMKAHELEKSAEQYVNNLLNIPLSQSGLVFHRDFCYWLMASPTFKELTEYTIAHFWQLILAVPLGHFCQSPSVQNVLADRQEQMPALINPQLPLLSEPLAVHLKQTDFTPLFKLMLSGDNLTLLRRDLNTFCQNIYSQLAPIPLSALLPGLNLQQTAKGTLAYLQSSPEGTSLLATAEAAFSRELSAYLAVTAVPLSESAIAVFLNGAPLYGEVLEKMELSAHIAQNTARLNPRDLEQMVRDFAQPYFTHIQNVGWWGAVFALPGTIINLLL